jgi:DNA-binding NarL/FixJ family response regulator
MFSGEFTSPSPVLVLVGENTRIHSELLAEALKRNPRIEVLGAVCTAQEFHAIASRRIPNVVILNAAFDEEPMRGVVVMREFHGAHPHVPIVMLLDCCKKELVLEAFRSGAKGIFSKNESLETLCKCVLSVHAGQVWANSLEVRYVLEALRATPTIRAVDAQGVNLLSPREVELVGYLAQGLTNREIGKRMQLSPHTVKNYLLHIFDKLGVSNRVELLSHTLSHVASAPRPRQENPELPPVLWCHYAAEHGAPYAQLLLAEMYAEGKVTPRDPVQAYVWYCIAEAMSEPSREQMRRAKNQLAASLRVDQRKQAEAKADQWLQAAARSTSRRGPESVIKLHPSSESSGRMAAGD